MPKHQVEQMDPVAAFQRTGMIARYCVTCWHAQWNHRGVYPAKRECNVQECSCRQYVQLYREQQRLL